MLTELLQINAAQIILVVTIIFIAYMVKGISGFGSGLIAIPLLAFFLPLAVVVPTLGLLSYSGTIYQSISLRKHVAWRDILPLLPFSLLGIALALWLLVNLSADTLAFSLGAFIVAYSLYSLFKLTEPRGGRRWAILAGSLGGFISAIFGTGGPFYVIYLKLRELNKAEFRASIAMVFLIDGGARITGYALSGLYNKQVLWLLLLLWPVLVLGMWIGHRLHHQINQKKFNQMVNVLLCVSGVLLMVKTAI